MPPMIRAILTIAVLCASALIWMYRDALNLDASPVLMWGLTIFMAGSVWLFPEFKKDAKK